MTSHHPSSELDTDSVTSSPRSDHFHEPPPRVRFMCSFGGKILPRPHDNQLRYVGGDTRIVAVHRSISFSALLLKLSKLSGMSNITAKYQLPNEDLDALISVTTDEDVENMMDEYDRVARNHNSRSLRLRLFLFPETEPTTDATSRANSITSLLNGSANRENWFLDALNGGVSGGLLERGRSEASSMVSEVPDYLFGLDKDRPVLQDTVSNSDPGSPAPVVSSSSPFCSTSSAPPIPNLPPVKTKLSNSVTESKENQLEAETGGQVNPNPNPNPNPNAFPVNHMVHYAPDSGYSGHPVQPIPVYYIPSGPVQPGTLPVQPVPIQAPYPYVQQQPYHHHHHHGVGPAQVPIGYHHLVPGSGQVFGAGPGIRHLAPEHHPYSPTAAVAQGGAGIKQHVYQAAPNSGAIPVYSAVAVMGGDEVQRGGAESDGSGHQLAK